MMNLGMIGLIFFWNDIWSHICGSYLIDIQVFDKSIFQSTVIYFTTLLKNTNKTINQKYNNIIETFFGNFTLSQGHFSQIYIIYLKK